MLAQGENTGLDDNNESPVGFGTADLRMGGAKMSEQDKLKAYQQSDNYGRVPQPGLPTYTEAWALIEAARRMATTADFADQENTTDRNKVRDAIRLNWRLWTIFQAEMTVDDAHTVPDEIRVNMLTLCKFVDQHTIETLREPTPEKVSTLIEINRNIAAGLLDSLKQLQQEMGEDASGGGSSDENNVTSIATNV